jgi:NADH dehydrogenase FAD-containing subunit
MEVWKHTIMGKQIVFVGAGHAHLAAFRNLEQFTRMGHTVTVISPSSYYYYSGTGPGLLSGMYTETDARINTQRMVTEGGADYQTDSVEGIDSESGTLFLKSGKRLKYDLVSFNIGSYVPMTSFDLVEGNVLPAKPIVNYLHMREEIFRIGGKPGPVRVVVVGGGPAGVEISGNMWRFALSLQKDVSITLVAGPRLLARFPKNTRKQAYESLVQRNISVLEGVTVTSLERDAAHLSDGSSVSMDFGIVAAGVEIDRLFVDSHVPVGGNNGLLVNSFLQSVSCPEIFGGGDCIDFNDSPLTKAGVIAYRQSPILFHNLRACLAGKKLKPFRRYKKFLLIFNLGDGNGILWRNKLSVKGKFAFQLKKRIDERFIRTHQKLTLG